MTVPSVDCSVFMSGEAASTVTFCSTPPTDNVKSMRARWPVSRFTWRLFLRNPLSSMSTV